MILLLCPHSEPNLAPLIAAAEWARQSWKILDTKNLQGISVTLDGLGRATSLTFGETTVPFELVTGIWTRGLGMEPVPTVASPENLIYAEWTTVLKALPEWIPGARWLNPLDALANSNRLRQLAVAGKLGFSVPRSVITTHSGEAKEFLCDEGAVIIKRLSQGKPSENADRILFAKQLSVGDMAVLDDLGPAPVLLQSVRQKVVELRTIVVGGAVFTAGFSSARHTETMTDTRMWVSTDDTYYGFRVHPEIEAKAVALTKALGLAYGALDLLVDADGAVTFLEINNPAPRDGVFSEQGKLIVRM